MTGDDQKDFGGKEGSKGRDRGTRQGHEVALQAGTFDST